MQNSPKTIMSARQRRPAASSAARAKRWTSSVARPEPKGSQNAQRNYERYLALARAEALIGDTVCCASSRSFTTSTWPARLLPGLWTAVDKPPLLAPFSERQFPPGLFAPVGSLPTSPPWRGLSANVDGLVYHMPLRCAATEAACDQTTVE
jgi:hypothetical protein